MLDQHGQYWSSQYDPKKYDNDDDFIYKVRPNKSQQKEQDMKLFRPKVPESDRSIEVLDDEPTEHKSLSEIVQMACMDVDASVNESSLVDESMENISQSSIDDCHTNNNTSFSLINYINIDENRKGIYLSLKMTGIQKVRLKKVVFDVKCGQCQDIQISLKRSTKQKNKFLVAQSSPQSCFQCAQRIVELDKYSFKQNANEVKIGQSQMNCPLEISSMQFNKLCCGQYTMNILNNMVCYGQNTTTTQFCHHCGALQTMQVDVKFRPI